jgi:subtilisin-like proprotein convertase family protein
MERRLLRLGLLGLAVAAVMVAGASPAAAKKKRKVGGTADITVPVNAGIPDATANTDGLLASTTAIGGKKFKGAKVRDVNVTVQTTGANADAAGDLDARLTAPNGATSWLFASLTGQSIGPLTLDDQSVNFLAGAPPPQTPTALTSPYAGTAQPACRQAFGGCPLAVMNNGPATGTWTLRVYDRGTTAGDTSILNSWRLVVKAGKPYKTK